jgi:hypothetical protein
LNNVSPPARQNRTLARQLSTLPPMVEIFAQDMHQNGAYSCIKKSEMVQLCTAAEMPHGFIAFWGSIFKSLILNS